MKIIIAQDSSKSSLVKAAVDVLQKGGMVIYPTETTYGLGVDATNKRAVDRLLRYKSRREGKPLSIAVTDQDMAEQYVLISDQAKTLYRQFLPGPVTVISQDKGKLAKGVASEFGTVGVRIPDYPLVVEIVRALGKPITATSANASDQKRPYHINDILDHLSPSRKALLDLVIDAGQLPKRPPSTVIDTTLSSPLTVREGKLKPIPTSSQDRIIKLTSHNEQETKDIAGRLLLKYWNIVKKQGLLIGLSGKLGAGKTVFAKGVAKFLHIKDTITSPTYTYLEEYPFTRHQTQGMLYHLDVWKVDSAQELAQLKIEELLGASKVVVVEWFDHVKAWWDQQAGRDQATSLPTQHPQTILVTIDESGKHLDKQHRQISINTVNTPNIGL